nr:AIR synthase family protein [Candidatus Njordarchaeota archaeon]
MAPSISSSDELLLGKVPNDILKRVVFKLTGAQSSRVLSGPAVGEDAAVIDYYDRLLVVKSDPITGAEKNVGWLAVHINANDIAVRGARPLFYLSIIMLPEKFERKTLQDICEGIDSAAKELCVTVVGGHTEVTSVVSRPILSGTMIGETQRDKVILTSGAKVGDTIIATKSIALEGTAILASDHYDRLRGSIDTKLLRRAQGFMKRISVVREALGAAETGFVNCMKDPTEGGLLQALNEVTEASHAGYSIDESLVPIEQETRKICEVLRVDPLKLISSGMLIATVPREKEEHVVSKIKEVGVNVTKIGVVTSKGRSLRRLTGKTETVEKNVREELWKVLRTRPKTK